MKLVTIITKMSPIRRGMLYSVFFFEQSMVGFSSSSSGLCLLRVKNSGKEQSEVLKYLLDTSMDVRARLPDLTSETLSVLGV